VVGIVSFFAALLLALPATASAELRAGAAKTKVTPDLEKHGPIYLAGFGNNRRATGIHDDLYARCLALAVSSRPLVLCGVDSIGLFYDDVKRIREGIDADIVVAALHDHESPDTMGLWGPAQGQSGISEAYNTYVVEQTRAAIKEAIAGLQPARARLAKTHDPELDTFIDDDRPPIVHDSEVIALNITKADGAPLATLVNWANHPETLGSKNTLLTGDYSASVYRTLEEQLGGTAVFINGAVGGMQSPLGSKLPGLKDGTFEKADFIGKRVATLAAKAVKESRPVEIDGIWFAERIANIPLANPGFQAAAKANLYKGRKPVNPDGTTSAPVGAIRLLDQGQPVLEIALVPGELYPELSVGGIVRYEGADFPDAPFEPAIKRDMMTAPYRMLFGLADDEIGYIIPKVEWDNEPPWLNGAPKRYYGEVNSVGPDAAPVITNTLKDLLKL
jgi:hypothetical protein